MAESTPPKGFCEQLKAGWGNCQRPGPANTVLAVSGGLDSVALLHATVRLWPEQVDELLVTHVNHQLRANESEADASFVAATASSLGVKCRILTCDVTSHQAEQGGGVEEVARQLRYSALERVASELHRTAIVSAHHQQDQAETILHNILRGTGLKGLAGMSSVRPLTNGVRVIRPMLSIPRTTIEAWARAEQIEWREDSSNASANFTRNRIRQDLLPRLAKDYNPQVTSSLLRLSDHARDAENMVTLVAQRCLEDVQLELQPGVCRLDRTRLAAWPVTVVSSTLRLIWQQQSWPQQMMTQAHWQDLAAGIHDVDGKPKVIPGVRISLTPGIIRIFGDN